MEAIENILTRTSVREFNDQAIESDKLETIIKAAFGAPSAVNRQPWHFVIVDQPDLRADLAKGLTYCEMVAQSPVAIMVCGNKDKFFQGEDDLYWISDTSAACQNILLAAHALGLGAVWSAIYPEKERIDAVRRIMNLPDNLIPLSLIPIGYPAKVAQAKDKYQPESVSHNRF